MKALSKVSPVLALIVFVSSPVPAANYFWDGGNTNNGAIIDPAKGTWDLSPDNAVWNSAGANVVFANGNNALFGGADGAYDIRVAAAVNSPILNFLNSGYVLTNDGPQTITLGGTSTAVPKLGVAAGKTAIIGTNITVSMANSSYIGSPGDTPGGTLIIGNGGLLLETTANTMALDGAGSVISIKTGGILRHAGGVSGQLAIGASNTGNAPTVSVDGGGLEIIGNNKGINVGNGTGPVAGILTLNAGSVSMPAGTTKPVTLGVNAGNAGTLNFNGGTLNAAQIIKGDASAFATNNFNGGTLKAVNATFASGFMNGLDRANVRNGGAVIDSGAFAVTIGQALEHSNIGGDNATDGGLVKLGAGKLTLTGVNTYTGITTVKEGTLALAGSLRGPVVVGPGGTLSGGPSIGRIVIGNNLTLGGRLVLRVDKSAGVNNDLVDGVTLLNYGGSLELNITAGNLVEGDVIDLFNAATCHGDFAKITVTPALPIGLKFDTSGLLTNGSLRVVVNSNALPLLSLQPVAAGLQLSWLTLPLYQYQVKTATNLANPLTNWNDFGPCLLGNGNSLSQVVTSKLPQQFFSLLTKPLPIDSSRLPAEPWKDTQWIDPGGWTTIDVTALGLPANNTNIDAAIKIASIINSSSGRRRLYFPTGVYSFKSSLTVNNKSDLWIDGDGRSNTVFSIDAPASASAEIGFHGGTSGSPIAVLGSPVAGDSVITVASASTLNVGDLIQLYADNAPLAQGGLSFVTHVYGQMCRIIAKGGNTLTLDMKLLLDYPESYTPLVQRYNQIKNIKVSNLLIRRASEPVNQDVSNLEFVDAYNCNVVRVESSFSQRHHIYFQNAKDCVIESNYVHDCFVHTTGGYGYGIGLVGSTDCRVSHNKSTRLRHQVILQIGANHNVISYNSIEVCYDYNDLALHAAYAYMNLFEGNMFTESYADTSKDGSTTVEPTTGPGNTWFRNYASGKVGSIQSQTMRQNVIGNDVGTLVASGSDHYLGANLVAGVNKTYPSSWTGGMTNWGVFPANVILPASLYLTNRPAFFKGTTPWPVFGPGVVNWGTTNMIPARSGMPSDP